MTGLTMNEQEPTQAPQMVHIHIPEITYPLRHCDQTTSKYLDWLEMIRGDWGVVDREAIDETQ